MQRAVAIVHASPAVGAGFTQYTAEFEAGGVLGPAPTQRFLFVVEGSVSLECGGATHVLAASAYAYLPTGYAHRVSASTASRVVVIEKEYQLLAGAPAPTLLLGNESAVAPQSLLGDPAVKVRTLLPDLASYDFAVNTMTFEPGASLSLTEMHVMEHGLLMLSGGGIYRLSDCWYPVTAGDFIWMAPFCPQWFGAIGKTPARYLIYKNWNRHP
jgi:(S)-ureidoglycine aminohydrolase